MNLTDLSITEAATLLESRQLSPVELTEAHLARIEVVEPTLTSFITITAEVAREQARQAEAAIQRGEYLGVLHGIPLAHKDLFETAGIRTTAGSKILAEHIPDRDATAVARLQEAGTILLGKLNMHEWAMSVSNNNPHFGACKNPWDTARIPGGSSGGSAAALAARLCMGSLGSDTGGSIRLPAALCGVVGLKATYGRISKDGAFPLSWSLDHAGPMARSVRDVAILLQALAGYDPLDPSSVDMPPDDYVSDLEAGIHGWRVAVAYQGFFPESKAAEPAVLAAVEEAARVMEQVGARVREVPFDLDHESQRAPFCIIVSDAAAYHRDWMATREVDYGEDVLEGLHRGARHTAVEYALARRLGLQLRRHMDEFFRDYDLLITPTAPTTAPLRDEPEEQRRARPNLLSYTAPWNLTGLPALSVPCGSNAAGLPIGLQLVAPHWAEARLLRAARALEMARGE